MDSSVLNCLNHLKDIVSTKLLEKNVFQIEETSRSPFVYINSEEGKIIFKGYGLTENSKEFFKPILDFLEENFKNTKEIDTIVVEKEKEVLTV